MAFVYPTASRPFRDPAWWRERVVAAAPAALTLVLATIVFLLGWRGVDQAAQTYRVFQFRAHGLMLWDSGWYGGNFPLGYSVLFPPVAALFGLQVVAGASAVLATWSFDRVVKSHLGARPLGTWYFAVSTMMPVVIGQWPFLAGEAAGLSALVLLQRGRRPWAVGLGIVAALFSPLAAAFLAMVCVAWAVYGTGRRSWILATAGMSIAVILLGGAFFPGDGPFPFPWPGLVVTELLCLTALTPLVKTTPAVRLGALLYAAASFFSFVVPNPLGGNAPRLAASIGVPLLACFATAPGPAMARLSQSALVQRILGERPIWRSVWWRVGAVTLVVPFAVWQWAPGQKIITTPANTPEIQATFYTPLINELSRLAPYPIRVEVTPTLEHWEAAFVAPHVSLARGWERQLDIADNPLFYTPGALNGLTYYAWLKSTGVSYVALPNAELDYAAQAEGALLSQGHVPGLVPVWSTAQWRVWSVQGSPGLVSGPGQLTSLEPDHFSLQVSAPATLTVRVRYTTFWTVTSGKACASSGPQGWTTVRALSPGTVELTASVLHKAQPVGCAS